MTIDQDKALLRERIREVRHHMSQKDRDAEARAVCARCEALIRDCAPVRGGGEDGFDGKTESVVSGFWPLDDEIDVRPLLGRLHRAGLTCALPVVPKARGPLIFRRWRPEEPLEPGVFGLRQPGAAAPAVVPRILIVPLLAFDRDGYRLGWGAGYYDRTLAALRAVAEVTAIGVGFSVQQVDKVPIDRHDQRLDFMVTQDGVIGFG